MNVKVSFFVLSSISSSIPYLVLVVGIAMTQVSYKPDEVGFKADDRGLGRVSIPASRREVLCSTENILTGLPYSMHLLQQLCTENVKHKIRTVYRENR